MRLEGNTVLITGGGTGIGRGLAEQFHARGNRVIIAARRRGPLEAVCAANPGMTFFELDVADPASVGDVCGRVVAEHPGLDCVINNAGVQRPLDFAADSPPSDGAIREEIEINLLGLVRVTSALLGHLRGRPRATLINVSSGLGLVPLSRFPLYCATKAAVHSLSLSLRHQLRDTGVDVIEIIPPAVVSELRPDTEHGRSPIFMPLEEFIATTMEQLAGDVTEVAAGTAARSLAALNGVIEPIFARMNP